MRNELLLIISLILLYSTLLGFYYYFGKTGLHAWTVLATITANIEVLILVNAFGMEQTLGNVLFASNFLVTDILSEIFGKEEANKAVNIGIATSFVFILISQSWLLYLPAQADWAMPSIRIIFKNTPRIMLSSFLVYAICQRLDVWLYHKWWALTTRLTGDYKGYLWLRNNGSTLLSQLLNSILYNFCAFAGLYDTTTLIQISLSSYLIYVVTSLADTPFVYWARKIRPKNTAFSK